MKKIIITGGMGFVGTHLTKVLSQNGFEITVFDKAISESKKEGAISFIKGDITNKNELKDAAQNIDVIVHLAAIVSVPVCEQNPELCHLNNTEGTENVFAVAKELGIKKVIYASSAAVYGNLESENIFESDETKPISNYGISKLENEKTAQLYFDSVPNIGLRFFNIYGPGLNMQNAYPSVLIAFFKKIKNGEPITIFGDGEQTRDFVHVLDVCQAIQKAIDSDIKNTVYNVGTGVQTKINTLADIIKKYLPHVQISFEPKRGFDIAKSCSSISKIEKELDFKPTYKIVDDLEELLNIYTK